MNESYLLQVAQQRFASGHIEGAIDSLRQLLGDDPMHAEAHALLALCLLSMRRAHAAEREADLALSADPHLELAHYAAARVAVARRCFKCAGKHLAQLLDSNPQEAAYHLAYAELCDLTRRQKEQFASLQRAVELAPDDPNCLAALAGYYRQRGDVQQAERFARETLQLQPNHHQAVVIMGHLLLRRGETEAAREHAIWVLREDANDVSALYLLSAVKAHTNPFLGLWWRYNSWMSELGPTRAIIVLLGMFVLYRVVVIATTQQGYAHTAEVIGWVWMGFVIYSFAGPQIFRRSLEKELAQVKLSKDF